MSLRLPRALTVCASLGVLSLTSTASAQWFASGNPCCAQPIRKVCYRTVPVTEYRQVRQTVQKPVYETKWVNRQFTEYRPVTETRTATIPTVSYQNVTELKTVCRNAGYWRTRYQCNPRMSPCQYDNRPDLLGWFNRTGYSIRQSFTPRVIAFREYVPQTVVQQIPVTRRIVHRGTRQVSYKVTRLVRHTTTRKVAIRTVRYVSQQIVTTRPVTVMRTIPIGTAVAYGYSPYYGASTATALAPQPTPAGTTKRTADSDRSKLAPVPQPKKFSRETSPGSGSGDGSADAGPARRNLLHQPTAPARRGLRSVPSIVRAHRWMPSRRHVSPTSRPSGEGPVLSVAGTR